MKALLIGLGLGVVVAGAAYLMQPTEQEPTAESTPTILEQIIAQAELHTASSTLSTTVDISQSRQFVGFEVGNRTIRYQAVGEATAGVDLSQATLNGNTITLPPATILSVAIDPNRSTWLDDDGDGFAPDDRLGLIEIAESEAYIQLHGNACQSEVLSIATEQAKIQVERLVAGYNATVQTSEPTCHPTAMQVMSDIGVPTDSVWAVLDCGEEFCEPIGSSTAVRSTSEGTVFVTAHHVIINFGDFYVAPFDLVDNHRRSDRHWISIPKSVVEEYHVDLWVGKNTVGDRLSFSLGITPTNWPSDVAAFWLPDVHLSVILPGDRPIDGDTLTCIGFPHGIPDVTQGQVLPEPALLNRAIAIDNGVNSGNSGGVCINDEGQYVGMPSNKTRTGIAHLYPTEMINEFWQPVFNEPF